MDYIKKQFLLDKDIIFLNHGSFGSCPKPIFQDYQNWQKLLESQPVQFLQKSLYPALKKSRVTLSNFIGCSEDEIIFFENPTTAVSNIIYNLKLKRNDEVLMTNHEYGALVRAWCAWSKKTGVKIVQQKIPVPILTEKQFTEAFFQGITKKTKVIFISQITSPTALIFPIKHIINYAKKNGIITIVDGAHVPGHIELNINDLGCDFYTGAIHKWLCAPKGTSFLYVKKKHQTWVKPLIYSWGKNGDDPTPSEFLQNFQWQGTRDMSSFLTIPKAIEFYDNNIKKLQSHSREKILKVFNLFESVFATEPISSGGQWLGQMVSHPLPNTVGIDLKEKLWEQYKIEIPIFTWNEQNFIRISIQVYNNSQDVESLIKALKTLV